MELSDLAAICHHTVFFMRDNAHDEQHHHGGGVSDVFSGEQEKVGRLQIV